MPNDKKDMFQMALSILLAAAIAHGLYITATELSISYSLLWAIISGVIIAGVILLIMYMLDTKIEGWIHFFKTSLIGIVTLNVFFFC